MCRRHTAVPTNYKFWNPSHLVQPVRVMNTLSSHCVLKLNGNRLYMNMSKCNHSQSVTQTATHKAGRCAAAEASRISHTSLMALLPKKKNRYNALNEFLSISPAQMTNYNKTELPYALVLLLSYTQEMHNGLLVCWPAKFCFWFPCSYLHDYVLWKGMCKEGLTQFTRFTLGNVKHLKFLNPLNTELNPICQ